MGGPTAGRRLLAAAVALTSAALVTGIGAVGSSATAASVTTTTSTQLYFHGAGDDDPSRVSGPPYSATFDGTAPSGTSASTQLTPTSLGNRDQAANILSIFWTAPFTGTLGPDLEFRWYWSTTNAAGVVSGVSAYVTVFKDVDYAKKTGTKIAQVEVPLQVSATPLLNVNRVALTNATESVATNLLVQVTPRFVDTGPGLRAHYDSTATPSSFVSPAPVAAAAPVQFAAADDAPVSFAPATIVSAHFLGAEPQTTMERPLPGVPAGTTDRNRVFVDWPLSSRSNTGQLSRSQDGGDSFRLILDTACAPRSRPNCFTGGGGDTETEVNPYTGHVLFGDQEVLAQEALASSTDHGDTFPANRQFAGTSAATGVDRQWLAAIDPAIRSVGGQRIEAFYSYHVPLAGQYVVGVTEAGVPITPAAPQVVGVEQSGQPRVDSTDGPGRGWIYQPYRQGGAYRVATASAANYETAAGWQTNTVANSNPTIFPWLSLDSHGNAYAVWVNGSVVYYSYSRIDDPANNPTLTPPGRPGTAWSPAVRIDPPYVGAAVYPEVVAGDPGQVAIAYDGTEDYTGDTSKAPPDTRWYTYVSVLDNGLALGGAPITVRTGRVSHRIIHTGNICTSGTTCAATTPEQDRSLLDMIDLGVDADGRVGVVFTDNNSALQTPADPKAPRLGPFTHYAKQVSGPSLFAGTPPVSVTTPRGGRPDPAGDATWPNRADGKNLTSLDALGASLGLEGSELVARVPLGDAAAATMTADLAAYNTSGASVPPAQRVQYVVRFSTNDPVVQAGRAGDVFHVSMEQLADGTRRFFGGRIDANDSVKNTGSPTSTVAVGYHTDTGYPVTGTVEGNTLVLRAPASAFGVGSGTELYSVTAFTMAGPTEANDQFFTNTMRTVDATPPFDTTLGVDTPSTDVPEAPLAVLLPVAALGLAGLVYAGRRRRRGATAQHI